MICPICQYPSHTELCENPACPQDKGKSQLVLIESAKVARKAHEKYLRQHRGIDYSMSARKRGKDD